MVERRGNGRVCGTELEPCAQVTAFELKSGGRWAAGVVAARAARMCVCPRGMVNCGRGG